MSVEHRGSSLRTIDWNLATVHGVALVGLGGVLLVASLAVFLAHEMAQTTTVPGYVFELVVLVGLPAIVIHLGLGLSSFEASERRSVLRWTVAGLCVLLLLGVLSDVGEPVVQPLERAHDLTIAANLGTVFGIVVGRNRARSMRIRRLQRRTERRERALHVLNNYLRHHTRNGVQLIDGYSRQLEGCVDEDGARYLAVIGERNAELGAVVDDVGAYTNVVAGEATLEPIELAGALESAIAAGDLPEDIAFAMDCPTGTAVRATELLVDVFETVLTTTIRLGDPGAIDVTVTEDGDEVVVRVESDGAPLPRTELEAVLENGRAQAGLGTARFGLHLVSLLVEEFGGTLAVGHGDVPTVTVRLVAADR